MAGGRRFFQDQATLRARPRLGFVTYYIFPIGCRVKQYAGKSLKFHRDNAKNLSLFGPENAISA